MPNFHNPLGSLMPDDKKKRLYELLCEYDLPAIEDDVYADTHFGDVRPKPLKAWDRDGRVMLCSSFGKTLAPSFRVGWAAPGRYLERVRRLKFTNTMGTAVVLQKTLAEFLHATAGYDHHLRSLRRAYHQQLHLFAQTMQRHFSRGHPLQSSPRRQRHLGGIRHGVRHAQIVSRSAQAPDQHRARRTLSR